MRTSTAVGIIAALSMLSCHAAHFILHTDSGLQRYERAVVQIRTNDGWGSGFAIEIDHRVYVATAYHVVATSSPIVVIRSASVGDSRYETAFPGAVIEATDARHDIALLSLPHAPPDSLDPLSLADGAAAQGTAVRAIGFPASSLSDDVGLVAKPPFGRPAGAVVSIGMADSRDPETTEVFERGGSRMLIVDVNPTHGNSGGPLLDENGHVVGVVVLTDRANPQQDGAVDVQYLRRLEDSVRTHHAAEHDILGNVDTARVARSMHFSTDGAAIAALSSATPAGDLHLEAEDRERLENLLEMLLGVYFAIPSDGRDAAAYQNLFRVFAGGDDSFGRVRRVPLEYVMRGCVGDSERNEIPVVRQRDMACMVRKLLPPFARDALEAVFNNEQVAEVISLRLIDRRQRKFEASARLTPSNVRVSFEAVYRDGGWRIGISSSETSGLTGVYAMHQPLPDGHFEMVCLPGLPSDCTGPRPALARNHESLDVHRLPEDFVLARKQWPEVRDAPEYLFLSVPRRDTLSLYSFQRRVPRGVNAELLGRVYTYTVSPLSGRVSQREPGGHAAVRARGSLAARGGVDRHHRVALSAGALHRLLPRDDFAIATSDERDAPIVRHNDREPIRVLFHESIRRAVSRPEVLNRIDLARGAFGVERAPYA